MTAKEKARELVLKFAFKGAQHEGEAKTFALIAVDEIIEFAYNYTDYNEKSTKEYLEEVKKEINKL